MLQHKEECFSPYTSYQLYSMVADVERYPEFLPWCSAARILVREETMLLAELVITFKAFREKYTSRVYLSPPHALVEAGQINVEMVEGPFSHLKNIWHFLPQQDGRTLIQFEIDFAFQSRILDALIGVVFQKAAHSMVEAFTQRADQLYKTL